MESIRKVNAANYRHQHYDEDKTQAEMTMEYMRIYGTITQDEAYAAFDCKRLAAVIYNLKLRNEIFDYRGGPENISIYALDKKKLDAAIARINGFKVKK